jgi:hypothetical protein
MNDEPDRHGAPPPRRPQERAGAERDAAPHRTSGPVCDLCGGTMYERHCRIICPTCGYQRDCSDP